MPGWFVYGFYAGIVIVGMIALAFSFMPVTKDHTAMFFNRRSSVGLMGLGALITGLFALIGTYTDRHTSSAGVLYVSEEVISWGLLIGLGLISTGLIFLAVVSIRHRSDLVVRIPQHFREDKLQPSSEKVSESLGQQP